LPSASASFSALRPQGMFCSLWHLALIVAVTLNRVDYFIGRCPYDSTTAAFEIHFLEECPRANKMIRQIRAAPVGGHYQCRVRGPLENITSLRWRGVFSQTARQMIRTTDCVATSPPRPAESVLIVAETGMCVLTSVLAMRGVPISKSTRTMMRNLFGRHRQGRFQAQRS
jgi:hypothetical protein